MRLVSRRRTLLGLPLVLLHVVAAPGAAQAQDASAPIVRHYNGYRTATSPADSVRYVDSMLATSLAMLRRDSLDDAVLLLSAASYGMQGDTAHGLRALARVDTARLKPWLATSPVPSPVISVLPADLLERSDHIIRNPTIRPWRLRSLFFMATETLLYKLSQQHPDDPRLARASFAVATDAQAWVHVMVSGENLQRLDNAAAGLDTSFFATLLTAYDILRHSDARWGDGTCVGDGMMCYGFTDADRARMLEQALVVAQSATERFPDAPTLWRGYAVALRNAARPPKSDLSILLQAALRRHGGDPRFAHRLVAGFADAGDWTGAIAVAPPDTATDDTAYVRYIFAAYRNVGQFRQAAALARTLIRRYPTDTRLLHAVAFGCGELEDWRCTVSAGEALAEADSAVRGDRRYGLLMATAYDRLRRPRDAAAILAQTTAHAPQDAALWLRYAQALRQTGRTRPAAAAIVRAFQLDDADSRVTDAAVWLWYADELWRGSQLPLALKAVQRAAATAPGDPSVRSVERRLAKAARHGPTGP